MWQGSRHADPTIFYSDTSSESSSSSEEILPIDSAHLPRIVLLKNLQTYPDDSTIVLRHKSPNTRSLQSPPTDQSSLRCRSPASFVYGSRAPRRGTCLILSVDSFNPALCLPGRPGAEVDLAKLNAAFTMLDFEVKIYNNPTAADITLIVEMESKLDHSNADCFAFVILTHGDEGGLIYGTDGPVYLDKLISPFRGDSCPGLAGKPKLFFVQACRGALLDSGTLVETDSSGTMCGDNLGSLRRIPVEADLLVTYAVQPGYYAFRNSLNGSWFIQALTSCLERYGRTLDLLSILTRVNHEVAYEFESRASIPEYSGKKQVPSIVSTLTKDVFFHPKTPPIRPNDSSLNLHPFNTA